MTTPPVSPGPDQPYTLSNLMPAPSGTAPASVPPPPGPPLGFVPPAPTRKPHWWRDLGSGGQAAVIAAAVVVPAIVLAAVLSAVLGGRNTASSDDLDVSAPSCRTEATVLGAVGTASFTITNNGDKAARNVRVGIEYRDSGGARVDTDTARVSDIPAGDTVRVEESTNLDASASSGTCSLVGISAD